jgi:hypothetical protein
LVLIRVVSEAVGADEHLLRLQTGFGSFSAARKAQELDLQSDFDDRLPSPQATSRAVPGNPLPAWECTWLYVPIE